jgi:hypothetical protein
MTDYHDLQAIDVNVRERLEKAEKTIKEFVANIKMQTSPPVTSRKDKKSCLIFLSVIFSFFLILFF